MQSAIVVVGDEILSGHTQDTNSHYLAGRLARLGVPLAEKRVVGDRPGAIQGTIYDLQEHRDTDLVLVCGGLGPTHDDRTVAAVANLHGVPLVLHTTTWDRIQERAKSRAAKLHGKPPTLTAGARKMALVPQGCQVFQNEAGAAPGLALQRPLLRGGTGWTLIMPGVPQEMRMLWQRHLEPLVVHLAAGRNTVRQVIELEYHGFESEIAEHLERIESKHPGVSIGSYPHWGQPRVVLRLSGHKTEPVENAARALTDALLDAGHKTTRLPPASDRENV